MVKWIKLLIGIAVLLSMECVWLSHILGMPSISSEKPSISIEIPSISIESLGFWSKH